jgi:hypothetical protein
MIGVDIEIPVRKLLFLFIFYLTVLSVYPTDVNAATRDQRSRDGKLPHKNCIDTELAPERNGFWLL